MYNFVFRSLPLNRDSRTARYKEFISSGNLVFNTWEDIYLERRIGFEKLKIGRLQASKIISYPLYLLYLFIFSLLNIRKGDRVICMDLDTFIPVFVASFYKGANIYLDVVDPISQTKFSKFPFPKVFDYLEFFLLKFRKLNILPNENRAKYYEDKLCVNVTGLRFLLVENVPVFSVAAPFVFEGIPVEKKSFDIGYFGTLDVARGLEELIEFAEKFKLKVLFAGMGSLENRIKEISVNSEYISFHGSFNSAELSYLYSQVRFTWAFYSANVFLHKYASPNKFYEHLAYNTPIITNQIVPMSSIVKKFNTGIVLDNNLNFDTLKNLSFEINNFDFNLADYSQWKETYENYSVDFISYESNCKHNNLTK